MNTALNDRLSHFLRDYWRHNPVEATQAGVHDHDDALTDWSEAGMAARATWRADARASLEAFDDARLDEAGRLDKRVALGELAQQDVIEAWGYHRRAPALYVEEALNGVHFLLARPPAGRTPAAQQTLLAARLGAINALLTSAQRNLDPARIAPEFLDIARVNVAGALRFVAGLPVSGEAAAAQRDALAAFTRYQAWLDGVTPRGGFALGRALYDRMLREHHWLDFDADAVYATGERLSAGLQQQMQALADAIAPGSRWQDVVDAQRRHHPTRETLLQTYHNEMVRARDFVLARDLVSIPPGERCEIRPTAEFLRATMPLGHFDKTPPFDSHDALGILYITPIDAALPEARQAELLQAHCFTAVRSICFHETYPGHHLQFWWSKQVSNDLRKQFPSNVYLEGWALYCEQMMEENGFFDTPELRLWQLKNTMWRSVRMMIDSGLHARGLTLEQGAQLLVDRAGLEPNTARGEVLRYTTSPTQPSTYMLGKLRILELRERFKQRTGAAYTLKGFHTWLLDYSSVSPGLIS